MTQNPSTIQQTRRRALRAAAAVTGQASLNIQPRRLVSTLGLVVATHLCACGGAQEPKATPKPAVKATEPVAKSTESPGDCIFEDVNKQWQCCQDKNFGPVGCHACTDVKRDRATCLNFCGQLIKAKIVKTDAFSCCGDLASKTGVNKEDAVYCAPWGPPAPPCFGGKTLTQWIVGGQDAA